MTKFGRYAASWPPVEQLKHRMTVARPLNELSVEHYATRETGTLRSHGLEEGSLLSGIDKHPLLRIQILIGRINPFLSFGVRLRLISISQGFSPGGPAGDRFRHQQMCGGSWLQCLRARTRSAFRSRSLTNWSQNWMTKQLFIVSRPKQRMGNGAAPEVDFW